MRGFAASPAGSHWQSLGTMSVATLPGGVSEAAIASAMSPASAPADLFSRTHPDIGLASETMSLVSGASAARCHVAWSPITLTMGVFARRALCRFARPLARPGPRCTSVIAGLPRHPRVTVGGAGAHALEQREHRAHSLDGIERGDQRHFGGAGIGEAYVDAGADRGFDESLSAVHRASVLVQSEPSATRRTESVSLP